MNIITRKAAKEQGIKRYFTGKPCPHGHVSERYVSSCNCFGCAESNKEAIAATMKTYYEENKEKLAVYGKAYNEENKEAIAVKAKARYEKNKGKRAEYQKAYYKANPEKRAELTAKRHAVKLRAIPKWSTAADDTSIKAMFDDSKRTTEETGIDHNVDHEMPLQGNTVSGLHVPDNLRVMDSLENMSKSNKWNPMAEIKMVLNDDDTYTQVVVVI